MVQQKARGLICCSWSIGVMEKTNKTIPKVGRRFYLITSLQHSSVNSLVEDRFLAFNPLPPPPLHFPNSFLLSSWSPHPSPFLYGPKSQEAEELLSGHPIEFRFLQTRIEAGYTDKKEITIFLMYKEFQIGAVAMQSHI
jgi:hypothetical protein